MIFLSVIIIGFVSEPYRADDIHETPFARQKRAQRRLKALQYHS